MNSHLFKLAREEMLKSTYDDGSRRLGCLVVLKGTIISRGHNTRKTHTQQKIYNRYRFNDHNLCKYAPLAHAETNALNRIRFLDRKALEQVEIYIYREYVNGSPALARPCKSCMEYIKKLGIRTIYYTTSDGFAEEKLIY